jgi:hypothetical protein
LLFSNGAREQTALRGDQRSFIAFCSGTSR